jgi:hypothetical protein
MGLVEVVLQKGFNNCSHDEIEEAYIETFGFPPCQSCTGARKYKDAYDALYKNFYKLSKIISMKPKADQKYYWNPEKAKVIVHLNVNGRAAAYSGNTTDQEVLEKLYNQPRRAGIVLLNPDYVEAKEPKQKIVTQVSNISDESDKDKVVRLKAAGNDVEKIKELTGISKTKIKKYLNE